MHGGGGGGARGGVQNVHNCRASLLLGSYCLPFGRRVGETFCNIYIFIGYILPTLVGDM